MEEKPVFEIMKNVYPLFIICVFFSCSSVKESIINTETGEKIIGFSHSCRYQIGKTKKSELTDDELFQMRQDSLYLIFQDFAFNFESETLIAGAGMGKYGTAKGPLKQGDPMEKAIALYGTPIATDIEYWRDEEHGIK